MIRKNERARSNAGIVTSRTSAPSFFSTPSAASKAVTISGSTPSKK